MTLFRSFSAVIQSLVTKIKFDSQGARFLRRTPFFGRGTVSSRRLNRIARGLPRPVVYLEIGVQFGLTFERVSAGRRIGVEPFPQFSLAKMPKNSKVFVGTSDEFFEQFEGGVDLVFVDGLHEANQTYKDLLAALSFLREGGIVLLDDVAPIDEASSLPSLEASEERKIAGGIAHHFWYGDVYKVLGVVLREHPELDLVLIDGDPNHVQALIWKKGVDSRVFPSTSAKRLMSEWQYADFFPVSDFLDSIKLLPEKEAIRLALRSRAA